MGGDVQGQTEYVFRGTFDTWVEDHTVLFCSELCLSLISKCNPVSVSERKELASISNDCSSSSTSSPSTSFVSAFSFVHLFMSCHPNRPFLSRFTLFHYSPIISLIIAGISKYLIIILLISIFLDH